MKKLQSQGYDIVLRSAGSHSPIDIVAIQRPKLENNFNGRILAIQSKPKKFSRREKARLESEYSWLSGEYMSHFKVITHVQELKGGE